MNMSYFYFLGDYNAEVSTSGRFNEPMKKFYFLSTYCKYAL